MRFYNLENEQLHIKLNKFFKLWNKHLFMSFFFRTFAAAKVCKEIF